MLQVVRTCLLQQDPCRIALEKWSETKASAESDVPPDRGGWLEACDPRPEGLVFCTLSGQIRAELQVHVHHTRSLAYNYQLKL